MQLWWSFHVIFMEFPCSFHLDNLFVLLMQGPAWNLHGTSMETPSKLHSSARWHRRAEQKETSWDCFCWNLHQTSIKTPWNLHGSCMSQTFGTTKGTAPKTYIKTPWNLHQFWWNLARSAYQTIELWWQCDRQITTFWCKSIANRSQIDRKSIVKKTQIIFVAYVHFDVVFSPESVSIDVYLVQGQKWTKSLKKFYFHECSLFGGFDFEVCNFHFSSWCHFDGGLNLLWCHFDGDPWHTILIVEVLKTKPPK